MITLSTEQKLQFNEILEEIGKTLDITPTQYEEAVKSYKFVGEWLADKDSPLYPYSPEILPQGSFLLGTMIRPVNDTDELDIDLVCRLEGKQASWTQFDLKAIVGKRLANNGILVQLLKTPDGRRCWTLQYRDSAKFHLDILPAIVSQGYRIVLEKAFSATNFSDMGSLAIRITDKHRPNYKTETIPLNWLECNPFGYAIWFENQASLTLQKAVMMSEVVQPVPRYQAEKLPLQRIVQILKRHRDMLFNGDEDKPISIIITTLAARAYRKQTNVIEGLLDVVESMPLMIEERYDYTLQKYIKWIPNPVNDAENFADKWAETPRKEKNFYNWLRQVKTDLQNATQQKGLFNIMEAFQIPFGEEIVVKAFSNIGEKQKNLRDSGSMRMDAGTGILSEAGRTKVPYHNNFGKDA